MLKTGKLFLQWRKVETQGLPPPPRYQHTMSYSEDQNLLIVFGGRCDFASKKNNFHQILNDLWLFSLENHTWYEVKQSGDIPKERFSHCATMIGA